jgi:hypothetical protein
MKMIIQVNLELGVLLKSRVHSVVVSEIQMDLSPNLHQLVELPDDSAPWVLLSLLPDV